MWSIDTPALPACSTALDHDEDGSVDEGRPHQDRFGVRRTRSIRHGGRRGSPLRAGRLRRHLGLRRRQRVHVERDLGGPPGPSPRPSQGPQHLQRQLTRDNPTIPHFLHDAQAGWAVLVQHRALATVLYDVPGMMQVVVENLPVIARESREKLTAAGVTGRPDDWNATRRESPTCPLPDVGGVNKSRAGRPGVDPLVGSPACSATDLSAAGPLASSALSAGAGAELSGIPGGAGAVRSRLYAAASRLTTGGSHVVPDGSDRRDLEARLASQDRNCLGSRDNAATSVTNTPGSAPSGCGACGR